MRAIWREDSHVPAEAGYPISADVVAASPEYARTRGGRSADRLIRDEVEDRDARCGSDG